MPRPVQFMGTLVEAIQALPAQLDGYKNVCLTAINEVNGLCTLKVDIPRTSFVASKGKSIHDYEADMLKSKDIGRYTQGYNNAYFFKLMPQYLSLSHHSQSLPQERSTQFAYYDDDNILCATSIVKIGEYWIAAVLRNLTAPLDQRQVTLFTTYPEVFLAGTHLTTISTSHIEPLYLNALKAQSIAPIFTGMFNRQGQPDNMMLEGLSAFISKRYHYSRWEEDQNHMAQRLRDYKPHLEYKLSQSIFKRNMNSFLGIAVSAVLVVGLALTLSGIFAPFGLALVSSLALSMSALGLGVGLGGMYYFSKNYINDEAQLKSYKAPIFEAHQKQDVDYSMEPRLAYK